MAAVAENIKATSAIVDRLFLLTRTAGTHGESHQSSVQSAQRFCEAVAAAGPPFTLQLLEEALFRDRELVPLSVEDFFRYRELAANLAKASIRELTVKAAPSAEDALKLAVALVAAGHGSSEEVRKLSLPGISWRATCSQGEGLGAAALAVRHVQLAAGKCRPVFVPAGAPWAWEAAGATVRHLERACRSDKVGTASALALLGGRWVPPRRALSAAWMALGVMEDLGVRRAVRRAAAHVCFGLAAAGLSEIGGHPLPEAVKLLAKRMLAAPPPARGGLDDHRHRTTALVASLAEHADNPKAWHPILQLVQLTYELELRRRPAAIDADFTLVDLLTHATSEMGKTYDQVWVQLLIHFVGPAPAGTHVRLPDGRMGVAVGKGITGDPWRPSVVVDGELEQVAMPVAMVTPLVRYR